MRGHAGCRRDRLTTATPAEAVIRGFIGGRGLCPGREVFRAGVPGQEPLECRPGEGLAAVASAFVEVGGEIGQDVEAGYLGGAGDGPVTAGFRAVSPLWEPRAFFLVTTGPRILALRGVIVLMPISG